MQTSRFASQQCHTRCFTLDRPGIKHRCTNRLANDHAYRCTQRASAASAGRLSGTSRKRTVVECRSNKKDLVSFSADKVTVRIPNVPEFSVPTPLLLQFAVPLAGYLVLSAVIGPILIGMAVSALAVGGAVAAGALAFGTFLLPLAMFVGFLTLALGPLLGVAVFIPKILSLVIAFSGLGLGFLTMTKLGPILSGASSNSSGASSVSGSSSNATERAPPKPAAAPEPDEYEQEVRQMARELREFDTLLAEKEEQKRVDEWRRQ